MFGKHFGYPAFKVGREVLYDNIRNTVERGVVEKGVDFLQSTSGRTDGYSVFGVFHFKLLYCLLGKINLIDRKKQNDLSL